MSRAIESNPWIIVPQPNATADVRLFCFPYAGGNAYMFRSWQKTLPENLQVCGIQLPGHASRIQEEPVTSLPKLVTELGDAIVGSLGDKYVFFGHSMGATLSFELARHLRRKNYPLPAALIVSGKRAPHLPDFDPPIHKKNNNELLADLIRLNGIPAEVVAEPDLLELYLPVFRADFQLCETYEYFNEPPLSCPIIAFGGSEDDEALGDRMSAWSIHTTKQFKSFMTQGDHFFIHSQEEEFLDLLRTELLQI